MIVQLPDGRTVEFPDSMSSADVNSAIEKELGGTAASPPSAGSPLIDSLTYIGKRALRGALDTGSNLLRGDPDMALSLAAGGSGETPESLYQAAQSALPNPGPAPNTVARYAGAVGEATASNPLLAMAFPGATLGGSLLGEAGEASGLPGGRLAGSLLGGGVGQLAEGLLRSPASLGALAKSLGDSTTYQAAGKALQSQLSDWMKTIPVQLRSIYSELDSAMHGKAIAGSPGVAPTLETLVQPGGTIPGEAERTGTPGKLWVQRPQGARQSTSQLITTPSTDAPLAATPDEVLPATESTIVRSPGIPGIPEAPSLTTGPATPLPAFSQTVNSVLRPQGAEGFTDTVGLAGKSFFRDKLQNLVDNNMVDSRSGPGRPQSWDAVGKLSTWLGQQISNPGNFVNDAEESAAKALYASLQTDRRMAAGQLGGPAMVSTFDEAQANAEQLLSDQSRLNQYVKPGTDPEDAARKALAGSGQKGGGTDLSVLRQHLPEATDELAAAHLSATPKDWLKLSPEAREALVPDPGTRNSIDRATAPLLPKTAPTHETAVSAILGSDLGPSMANALSGAFGGTPIDPDIARVANAILFGAAPTAARAIRTNPNLLIGPTVGAAAGSNPLSP